MKAREIRERLKGKIEPELLHCMEELAEHQSAQAQEIKMLAELLDKLTDLLLQLGTVTEITSNAVDDLKDIRGGEG